MEDQSKLTFKQMLSALLRSNRRHARYIQVFACLALLVAVAVPLVMRQYGVAMTTTETRLACQYAGNGAHTHNADCYDAYGNLVCPLPEKPFHTHTADCYATERVLTCTLPETEGHTHSEACYDEEGNLICTLPEEPAHTHSDACYEIRTTDQLICGMEETTEEHVHGPACFETVTVELPDPEPEPEPTTTTPAEPEATVPSTPEEDPTPAQEFSDVLKKKDQDGNEYVYLVVQVKAPQGALPKGSTMSLAHVDLQKREVQDGPTIQDKLNEVLHKEAGEEAAFVQTDAVDITFKDAQGNRIDPAKKVAVRVTTSMIRTFSDQRTAGDEAVANNSLLVLHVVDKQQTKRTDAPDAELIRKAVLVNQDEKDTSTGHEDTILFEAQEFSPYVVARVDNAANAPEAELEEEAQQTETEQQATTEASLEENAEATEEATSKTPAQTFSHSFSKSDGQMLMTVNVFAPEGAFPLGTTMQVKWVDAKQVEGAVAQAVSERTDGRVRDLRAVDITFTDADGQEIEPAVPITVTFASDLIDTADDSHVVHIDDQGNAEVIDALGAKELQSRDIADQADELVIESDQFSTYVVAVTTLHKELAASDGATYDITVDAPAEAGIPQDAELRVSEIVEGDEGYAEYLAQAVETAGLSSAEEASYARFFDIEIWSGEEKIEPSGDVQVSIRLMNANSCSLSSVQVVHFAAAGAEIVETAGSSSGNEVELTFHTAGFSVYSVVSAAGQNLVNLLNGQSFALVASDPWYDSDQGWSLDNSNNRGNYPDDLKRPRALMPEPMSANGNTGLDAKGVKFDHNGNLIGGDVVEWKFEKQNNGNNQFILSTIDKKGRTQYLRNNNGTLTLTTQKNQATAFVVAADSATGCISLSTNNNNFITNTNTNTGYSNDKKLFTLKSYHRDYTNNSHQAPSQLFTLAKATTDYNEYKATKISSTQITGSPDEELVIYLKKADASGNEKLYALSNSGEFVEVTESGDSVYWRGNQGATDNLKWKIRILAQDGYPTGYYHIYSENANGETVYWAPSETNNTALSDTPVGVTLQGRAANQYSTTIEGWDDPKYMWIGVQMDENGIAVPARQEESQQFMFASLSGVPSPGGEKQTVETVNSADLGLTIRMFDYTGKAYCSWNNKTFDSPEGQVEASRLYGMQSILGQQTSGGTDYQKDQTPNIVQASYTGNYPLNSSGNSIEGLFKPSTETSNYSGNSFTRTYKGEANNLFIKSVYDETGYFRYSSAENYAYLTNQTDDGGRNKFTVYKQIASPYVDPRNDQWYFYHGHFMPYNDISMTQTYVTNMYSQTDIDNPTVEDPRAYEEVYGIQGNPNFFTGMSMEGDFAQLTDGKDARGNDVIYKFTGDDDLWVFIDKVRVLDLGGIHEAVSGEINFATGVVTTNGVERDLYAFYADAGVADNYSWKTLPSGRKIFADNTTHQFNMYYLERGAGASNLDMTFNLPLTKKGSFNVDKTIGGEGTQTAYQDEVFAYRAYIKETNGNFSILNAERLKSATYEGTSDPITFDANDVFYLKHGESVTLQLKDADLDKEYYVEELGIDSNLWNRVTINGDDATPTPSSDYSGAWPSTVTQEGMSYVGCDPETAANRSRVSFVNEPKTHKLLITKRVVDANGNEIDPGLDTTFEFKVFFEGTNAEESAVGKVRPYKQGPYYLFKEVDGVIHYFDIREGGQIFDEGTTKVVAGVSGEHGSIAKIPAGYTVEIDGLLAGTQFWVEERETHPEMPYGYELLEKRAIKEDGEATYQVTTHEHAIDDSHPDYTVLDPRTSGTYSDPDLRDAEGRILPNKDAQFEIVNRYQQAKINVEKEWVNGTTTDAKVKVTIGRYRLLKNGETIPNPGTLVIKDSVMGLEGDDASLEFAEYVIRKQGTNETIATLKGNGTADLSVELPAGNYSVAKAVTTPEGYLLKSAYQESKVAEISSDNTSIVTFTETIFEKEGSTPSSFTLTLTDSYEGLEAGDPYVATYKVFDNNNNLVGAHVYDSDKGGASVQLTAGTYHVEKTVTVPDGYSANITNQTINNVSMNADKTIEFNKTTFTKQASTATLQITDSFSGIETGYNATYTVTDQNGTAVATKTWAEDAENGAITVTGLTIGQAYTVSKAAADVQGYTKSNGTESKNVTISEGTNSVTFGPTTYTRQSGGGTVKLSITRAGNTVETLDVNAGSTIILHFWWSNGGNSFTIGAESYPIVWGENNVQVTVGQSDLVAVFPQYEVDPADISFTYVTRLNSPAPSRQLRSMSFASPVTEPVVMLAASEPPAANNTRGTSTTYNQTYEPTISQTVPDGYTRWVKDNYSYVVNLEDGHWSELNIPVDKVDENGNAYIYYVKSVEETGLEEGTTVTYPENLFISTDDGIGSFKVTNTIPAPVPTSVVIKKADADTMGTQNVKYLDGAVFQLQIDENGSWAIPVGVTGIDADGQFTIPAEGITLGNLTTGTYQLKEISAPAGYNFIIDAPVTFVVNSKGEITSTHGTIAGVEYTAATETTPAQFVIPNPPGSELPETGGPGTLLHTLCGLALFAAAGYVGLASKRSARKEVA